MFHINHAGGSPMSRQASSSGLEWLLVLFLLFSFMKATKVIAWSWWWVVSPLWLPFATVAAGVVALSMVFIVVFIINLLFISRPPQQVVPCQLVPKRSWDK